MTFSAKNSDKVPIVVSYHYKLLQAILKKYIEIYSNIKQVDI